MIKKSALAILLSVSVALLSGCLDPEEEAKEHEEALAKTLSEQTLAEYRGTVWNDSNSEVLKLYLKKNSIPETEFDGFRRCLIEYANTKSSTLKTTDVLGWCSREYKDIPQRYKSHVDLLPFFGQFSAWDGAFMPTEKALKKTLNDPDSYKHDESSYRLHLNPAKKGEAPYAIVTTRFRAKNGFGAYMRGSVVVKFNLKTTEMSIIDTQGI